MEYSTILGANRNGARLVLVFFFLSCVSCVRKDEAIGSFEVSDGVSIEFLGKKEWEVSRPVYAILKKNGTEIDRSANIFYQHSSLIDEKIDIEKVPYSDREFSIFSIEEKIIVIDLENLVVFPNGSSGENGKKYKTAREMYTDIEMVIKQ